MRESYGVGNREFQDIEPNSDLKFMMDGKIILRGEIGTGTTITTAGVVELYIQGTVCENVKFIFKGASQGFFKTKPPESVWNNIQTFGSGKFQVSSALPTDNSLSGTQNNNITIEDITVDGGNINLVYNSNPQKGLPGSRNQGSNLTVRGLKVSGGSISIANSSNVTLNITKNTQSNPLPFFGGNGVNKILRGINNMTRNLSDQSNSFTFIESNVPSADLLTDSISRHNSVSKEQSKSHQMVDDFDTFTKTYIKGIEKEGKITDILNALNLSEEEESLLDEYRDPITEEVMNCPVRLFDRVYELEFLLDLLKKGKPDPYTQLYFKKSQIHSARDVANKIQDIVLTLKKAHSHEHNACNDEESSSKLSKM